MKYSADEMHKYSEVITNVHWHVKFSGPPFRGYEDELSKMVTLSSLPTNTHTSTEVSLLGLNISHPGIVNPSGTITITFLETVKAEVIKCLEEWKNKYNRYKVGKDYEHIRSNDSELFGTIELEILDKRDRVVKSLVLNYCSLEEFTYGGDFGDGTSLDYFKPVLTVHYLY